MANAFTRERPELLPATAAKHSYQISIDFDIKAVTPQWRELELRGELTPFQTQSWLLPWYRIVAPAVGASPIFVTVRDKTLGRPLMLLPLCLRANGGLKRIEFPDLNLSDYNAPLLASDFQPDKAEFSALWNNILRALPSAD